MILNLLKVAVFIAGVILIIDGIGSILVQPTQPFFWFQFVRCFRASLGGFLIFVAAKMP